MSLEEEFEKFNLVAKERENYWANRLVETQNFLNERFQKLQVKLNQERETNKAATLKSLYNSMVAGVEEVQVYNDPAPMIKSELIDDILELYIRAVDNIKNNDLAKKYGFE